MTYYNYPPLQADKLLLVSMTASRRSLLVEPTRLADLVDYLTAFSGLDDSDLADFKAALTETFEKLLQFTNRPARDEASDGELHLNLSRLSDTRQVEIEILLRPPVSSASLLNRPGLAEGKPPRSKSRSGPEAATAKLVEFGTAYRLPPSFERVCESGLVRLTVQSLALSKIDQPASN